MSDKEVSVVVVLALIVLSIVVFLLICAGVLVADLTIDRVLGGCSG